MAFKDFQQFFGSDFKGIDGQRSALELEDNYVNRAVNLEMSVGNSLRGRIGVQTSGSYGFTALAPWRYTRTQDQYDIVYQTAAGTYPNQTPNLTTTKTTADAATIEKVFALGYQGWTLETIDIPVTYVSGTYPFTWYTYVNGSNINFCIKANGVSILDTSLGDGIASAVDIFTLLNLIDATSELSVSRTTRGTCPPFAVVNGNQNSAVTTGSVWSTGYQLTVDAGHNFTAGDVITINSSGVLVAGIIFATTATTISYWGPSTTVVDDQVLGYMAQAANMFPIDIASSAASGNLTISFPVWRPAFNAQDLDNGLGNSYATFGLRETFSIYQPPAFENALGNLYLTRSCDPSIAHVLMYDNQLLKWDGQIITRAGLPKPTNLALASNGGTGGLTGTFKYKAFYRRRDHQGNIWDGTPTDVGTITLSSDATVITLTTSDITGGPFQVRGCYKNTTESPANSSTSFYVDAGGGSPAYVQPGDIICLTDNTAQTTGLWTDAALSVVLGTLHATRCTAYTAQATTISPTSTSIRVEDAAGYQINDNTAISNGFTVVFLRTTNAGNQYYILGEAPINCIMTSYTIYDDVTDAVLITKEQFIDAEIGKEHDPPPACSLVCQHQGGLVVTRNPLAPNTVAFSTAEGIEYFPTASNSLDVPSTQAGGISAIVSDTDDRLAVFKERAYYDIVGDLDGGIFSVNIKNEGDYGIPSQASIVRLPIGLVGLSRNGWVVISDGFLNPYVFEEVNARVINQNYYFEWAQAVNDSVNRNYICTIPAVDGEPVAYVIDYSRRKQNPEMAYTKILEREYPTQMDQALGAVMSQNVMFHLSQTSPRGVFRRLPRFNGDSPSGNGDGDSFIDNTSAISYVLESAVINRGEPETLKTPVRCRIWSIPNDYVNEGWIPFTLAVETGASPLSTYIGNPSPNATDASVTFSAEADVYKDIKLVNCKTHFYIVRFTTNTIRQAPFLTGYKIMYAESYNDEDFIK